MGMFLKLQIWIITCKVKEVEVSKDAWRNRENRMHLVDVSIQIWDNLGQDHDSLFDATKIHLSGCRFILPHPNFMWKSEVSVPIEGLQVMTITITPRTSTLAGFTLSHHLTPESA